MRLSKIKYLFIFCAVLLLFVTVIDAQSGNFSLGLYQGVRLSDHKIVESKDPAADLTVSPRYKGYVAYAALQAPKLKEFETKPNLANLTVAEVEKFEELVFGPAPGYYYFLKTNDNRYYLCKLEKFENQGKAASYWKLTFSYEEIRLKTQGTTAPAPPGNNGVSHGKKAYPDGTTYEGDFVNGQPQGKGVLQSPDGSYEGDFVNGKPQGKGTIHLADGTFYEGGFADGEFNGPGNIRLPNGNSYKGNFENGMFQGWGILRFSDGGSYEGEFVNGKCNGEGTMYNGNGQVLQKGRWINNQFSGATRTDAIPPLSSKSLPTTNESFSHDKKVYSDGSSYEGDFVNGKRHGKGVYRWPSGASYQGDFVNGNFQGKGIYKWPSGASYEGDYVNDKRTGKGIYRWSDGRYYEGEFVDGKFQGKGILYDSNGQVLKRGQWADDQLIASDQANITAPSGDIYYLNGDNLRFDLKVMKNVFNSKEGDLYFRYNKTALAGINGAAIKDLGVIDVQNAKAPLYGYSTGEFKAEKDHVYAIRTGVKNLYLIRITAVGDGEIEFVAGMSESGKKPDLYYLSGDNLRFDFETMKNVFNSKDGDLYFRYNKTSFAGENGTSIKDLGIVDYESAKAPLYGYSTGEFKAEKDHVYAVRTGNKGLYLFKATNVVTGNDLEFMAREAELESPNSAVQPTNQVATPNQETDIENSMISAAAGGKNGLSQEAPATIKENNQQPGPASNSESNGNSKPVIQGEIRGGKYLYHGKVILEIPGTLDWACISPNEKYVAYRDGQEINYYDIEKKKHISLYRLTTDEYMGKYVVNYGLTSPTNFDFVRWSEDGQYIVVKRWTTDMFKGGSGNYKITISDQTMTFLSK